MHWNLLARSSIPSQRLRSRLWPDSHLHHESTRTLMIKQWPSEAPTITPEEHDLAPSRLFIT